MMKVSAAKCRRWRPGRFPCWFCERARRDTGYFLRNKAAPVHIKGRAAHGNDDWRPRRHGPWVTVGDFETRAARFLRAGRGEVVDGGLRCVQPPLDEGTYSLTIDSSLGLLKPALTYSPSSVRVDSLTPAFLNTTVEVAGLFSDLEAPLTCLFGALSSNASLVSDTLLKCEAPDSREARLLTAGTHKDGCRKV